MAKWKELPAFGFLGEPERINLTKLMDDHVQKISDAFSAEMQKAAKEGRSVIVGDFVFTPRLKQADDIVREDDGA